MANLETNFTHPELQKGEVFFINAEPSQFNHMEFKTKRMGKIAYDGNGNQQNLQDWFPVFLQEIEVANSGNSLMELRRKQNAKA